MKWYRDNGLQPKERRNAGHDNNTRAYSLDDTKRTVAFIPNYADDHALVLPERVPGFQRDDIRLMPSCETKVKVHAAYTTAMSNLGMFGIMNGEIQDSLPICPMCEIFKFHWRRHPIEATNGFWCLFQKTLAKWGKQNCLSFETALVGFEPRLSRPRTP